MTTDKRQLKRWHLIYYLRVFENTADSLLGHVVDINEKGLRLVSEKPVETGKLFFLKMNYPQDDGLKGELCFEAESLWSNSDVNPIFFDTGFQIIKPNTEIHKIIKYLLENLNFVN
ncbi:MAG: PilZ domain-containing protein [Nitrospinota bacterium]